MPFRLRIAAAARADMDSIGEFIRRDNPIRAETFIEEIAAKIETIAERPFSFRARPDLKPRFRSAIHGSYVIVFQVVDEQIEILRVMHGARDIQALFRPPT
jgi:toxin ParE1/3/4